MNNQLLTFVTNLAECFWNTLSTDKQDTDA